VSILGDMLTLSIPLVNGGAFPDRDVDDDLYEKYLSLREDGFEGKELIHELLTDDWGPPPTGIYLKGTLDDGTDVDLYIPYE
jgi:hypothetical protein